MAKKAESNRCGNCANADGDNVPRGITHCLLKGGRKRVDLNHVCASWAKRETKKR